jgi:AraC-like DNA-binding protein
MDALSDLLRVVKLTSAVFLDAEFSEPWCVRSEGNRGARFGLPPETGPVCFFHVLIEGRCRARLLDAKESAELATGDLLLFPNDASHLMGSDLAAPPALADDIVHPPTQDRSLNWIRHGGGGAITRFVCGFVAFDRRLCGTVLEALPAMLRIPLADGPQGSTFAAMVDLAVAETASPRPGGASMLTRLSEVLFVEAIRRHIETLPEEQTGWLAGLRDRFVGKTLSLMHAEPARSWTVDELGTAVGLSRSALAQRFNELLGQPPMQYLTHWRLTLAAQQLANTAQPVGTIADAIGYESEAAFNRAFKREFGVPPAAWRKSNARSAATA